MSSCTESQDLIKLGNGIRRRRQEIGMSQEKVAEKVGISVNTVSRIEGGQSAMSIEIFIKIVQTLDMDANELLGVNSLEKGDDVKYKKMLARIRHGEVIPTAKQLKESEIALIKKKLGKDVEISVYQCGYAIYQVCSHSTVFPVHLCGDYLYACDGSIIHLPEIFFEKEKWYLRLMLEGEDRLNRNQEMKERNVSYSNVSEEWESMKDTTESVLERLLRHETVEEMLQILTEKQKIVVQRYFLQEKTQLQISKELGISRVAVRDTLLRAVCKIRKKYQLSSYQSDCRVECGVKE